MLTSSLAATGLIASGRLRLFRRSAGEKGSRSLRRPTLAAKELVKVRERDSVLPRCGYVRLLTVWSDPAKGHASESRLHPQHYEPGHCPKRRHRGRWLWLGVHSPGFLVQADGLPVVAKRQ